MIKVGFLFTFSDQSWLGGINYYRNLLEAIWNLPDRSIEPMILTGFKTPDTLLKDFPPVAIVRTRLLDRRHPLWLISKAVKRLYGHDLAIEALCRKLGISVLSHSGPLRPGSTVKTLGWIFDFQHKHMPTFFDAAEVSKRDKVFRRTCADCDGLIVSSRAARDDLAKFLPEHLAKARVLNFTSSLGKPGKPIAATELRAKYGLPEKFFHLPNQFWIHKNHRVVVDALAVLRSQGRSVRVAVTGNTRDDRHPRHFDELMETVKQSGVEGDFQVLGIIPYADMRGIMENAVAVINPSLFEGWSSTVEESKSMGKHVILSSIPVHVEQAPDRASYFPPNDPSALADAMWKAWTEFDPEADRAAMAKAREALGGRMRAFGRAYQEMVLEVAG
jgi:glycosyltransferase involved in cell wall biosynthesis